MSPVAARRTVEARGPGYTPAVPVETPYVAIQLIEIEYTKDERGGAEATRRARLPRGLPLPVIAGGVVHECRLASRDYYEPRTTLAPVAASGGRITICDRLRLGIGENLSFAGDPGAETWKRVSLFDTAVDTWGRVIWNEVRQTHDARWFAELIVNAGMFAVPPPADVFGGEPGMMRDLRRELR
jgi:hypothetical protein